MRVGGDNLEAEMNSLGTVCSVYTVTVRVFIHRVFVTWSF